MRGFTTFQNNRPNHGRATVLLKSIHQRHHPCNLHLFRQKSREGAKMSHTSRCLRPSCVIPPLRWCALPSVVMVLRTPSLETSLCFLANLAQSSLLRQRPLPRSCITLSVKPSAGLTRTGEVEGASGCS